MTESQQMLPELFQAFDRKVPMKYTIEKSMWKKFGTTDLENLVPSKLQIFGTFDNPMFLAGEVGVLCGIFAQNTRQKCKELEGFHEALYSCATDFT